MTREHLRHTALQLPAGERRELVEILWESLERDPEPLPEGQRRLLDERLEALERHPEIGSSWEDVERRVWDDD